MTWVGFRVGRRWIGCWRVLTVLVAVAVLSAGMATVEAEAAPTVVPVKCLPAPSTLSVASGGSGDTYSLDANGSLWGWGSNYFGEIGNGTRTDSPLPQNGNPPKPWRHPL